MKSPYNWSRATKKPLSLKKWDLRKRQIRYNKPGPKSPFKKGILRGYNRRETQAIALRSWDQPTSMSIYPTAAYRKKPFRNPIFHGVGGNELAAQAIKRAYRRAKARRSKLGTVLASTAARQATGKRLPPELLRNIYSYLPK